MGTKERLISETITFQTLLEMDPNVNFTKNDIVLKLLAQGFPKNTTTQNRVWTTLEDSIKLGALESCKGAESKHKNVYTIISKNLISDQLKKSTTDLENYRRLRSPIVVNKTSIKKPLLNILFYNTNDINEIHYIIFILEIIANRIKPISIMYVEKRLKKEKYTSKHPIGEGFIHKILNGLKSVNLIETHPTNVNLYRHTEKGKENLFNQIRLYKDLQSNLVVQKKNQQKDIDPTMQIIGLLEAVEYIRGLLDEKFTVKELEKHLNDEGIFVNFQATNSIVAKLDKDNIIRPSSDLIKSVYKVINRSKLLELLDLLKQKEIEKQKGNFDKSNLLIGKTWKAVEVGEGMFALAKRQYDIIDNLKNQLEEAIIAIDLHKETSVKLKEENESLRKQLEELNLKLVEVEQPSTFTPRPIEDATKKDLL